MVLAGLWGWGGAGGRRTLPCHPEAFSSQGLVHLAPAWGLTAARLTGSTAFRPLGLLQTVPCS